MAPSADQIAGAVLEEAVLATIKIAGFFPVENLHMDATIDATKPPVTIRGRGTTHQIDVVADPAFGYAFSNPARLLIEAKSYSQNRRVGLDVVRNAVGVLKDVSEFWRPPEDGVAGARRYHYRYAIFATTDFTRGAQECAFAQDIYLMPLRRSAFFRPVVDAIDDIKRFYSPPGGGVPDDFSLGTYRQELREALQTGYTPPGHDELRPLLDAVQNLGGGLIAVADRELPLFLVPRDRDVVRRLQFIERVRIVWDEEGWYIVSGDEPLFSFDLPQELFELYAVDGVLAPERAIRLKAERLGALQALFFDGRAVKIFRFELEPDWIEQLLRRSQ